MKRNTKRSALNKIINEAGLDVSPKPLATWNTDAPVEDFENVLPVMSPDTKHKKKVLGHKQKEGMSVSGSIISYQDVPTDVQMSMYYFTQPLWEWAELRPKAEMILREEGTFWFLDIVDTVIPKESEEHAAVALRNQKYLHLLQSKFGSEKYVERGSITINRSNKTKDLQTDEIKVEHMSTQVSPYDFAVGDLQIESNMSVPETTLCETIKLSSKSDLLLKHENIEDLLKSKLFLSICVYAARVLQFNQFYVPLAIFRNEKLMFDEPEDGRLSGFKSVIEEENSMWKNKSVTDLILSTPHFKSSENLAYGHVYLKPLWKFQSSLLQNSRVVSIGFNKKNPDIVAIGYSVVDQKQQQSGLVACWSIKNFEHPERHFRTEQAVTTVSFSENYPYLLAVGFISGGLSFYDVSSTTPSLLFNSFALPQGHKNPVWALKWLNKNGYEVLITTSTDGRVLQWSVTNGLQCRELLRLKSMPSKNDNNKDVLGTTQFDGGLCFDFNNEQFELYLIGTDSGYIHKCSTIHANQYFKTYYGHIAPVYKISWSPDDPDIFASCSADMTVKIWHQENNKATHDLLPIYPPNSPAYDLAWCPEKKGTLICLFGTELQIWDLGTNRLDPIFIHRMEDSLVDVYSCMKYVSKCACLFLGDCNGEVTVYRVYDVSQGHFREEKKIKSIVPKSLLEEPMLN